MQIVKSKCWSLMMQTDFSLLGLEFICEAVMFLFGVREAFPHSCSKSSHRCFDTIALFCFLWSKVSEAWSHEGVTSDANASDRLSFGVNSSNRARTGSYPDTGLTLQIQKNVLKQTDVVAAGKLIPRLQCADNFFSDEKILHFLWLTVGGHQVDRSFC